VWNVSPGEKLAFFKGHSMTVWSVAFSPDGRFALSGGSDKTLRLWQSPEPGMVRKP
jgi:WD40 repeat protein